jgi:hypothetical protein
LQPIDRKKGAACALGSAGALTLFSTLTPVVGSAFGGHPLHVLVVQLAPVFCVLALASFGLLLFAPRSLTPKVRPSRATWKLHGLRALVGIAGTMGLAASAGGMKSQGLSIGYVTMFGALSGVATSVITTLRPVVRPRLRDRAVEWSSLSMSVVKRQRPHALTVLSKLIPAGVATLATAGGFGFDPRVLWNPWVGVLVVTSIVMGVIPFVQRELFSREAEELRDPSLELSRAETTLISAKINAWMGLNITIACGTAAFVWGPLQFHPSLTSDTALLVAIVAYSAYAYGWQAAGTFGDPSLNGIIYVSAVPLGFVLSPWLLHTQVTVGQAIQQGGASIGIALAVWLEVVMQRRK